jgi:hypothetical protein
MGKKFEIEILDDGANDTMIKQMSNSVCVTSRVRCEMCGDDAAHEGPDIAGNVLAFWSDGWRAAKIRATGKKFATVLLCRDCAQKFGGE